MSVPREIEGIPLPSPGKLWKFKEVVYTHYTYNEHAAPGMKVVATIRSYALPRKDIKAFVKARMNRLPLPSGGRVNQWRNGDPESDRAINIYVAQPSWVVIELDPTVGWYFEPHAPGITAQEDYGEENCDLVHVMPKGPPAGPLGASGPGCTLIYFAVPQRLRKEWDHQKFLCHITLNNKRFDDPVDPDIPNDGGRFPFPYIEAGRPGGDAS